MPYIWDKTPDTPPQPQLNPLTNPALERNLSRWALVYFSNPPGKREQAINQLLRQIKSETSDILIAERARHESSAGSAEIRSTEVRSTENQDVRCSTCQHRNPPGHQFCGQCGAGLNPVPSRSRRSSVFAATQARAKAPPAQPDSEVQWLRDRALGHLYEDEAPAWRGWKYVLGGLLIALAGFSYLQWAPSLQTRGASPVTGAAPRMTAPASSFPAEKSSSAAVRRPPDEIRSAPKPAPPKLAEVQPAVVSPQAQDGHDRKTMPTAIQRAAQKSASPGATPAPNTFETGDSGIADLRLAQRYLGGSMGVRDSSEAAKLLWKSVRQQNTTAAVLLSELYARGDGVPKSCDQARLLLVAATKRGAHQAAEQLRYLESHGCR